MMRQTPKVLVVVPTEVDAKELRKALVHPDGSLAVHVCAGSAQALELLFGRPTTDAAAVRPRVVLLDLWTPLDEWRDILLQIRDHSEMRDVPVVVLGPVDDDWAVLRAEQLGADAFLTKPHSVDHLAAVVRETAGYWMSSQADPEAGQEGRGSGQKRATPPAGPSGDRSVA